ncbi:MAG: hypothetical protein GY835_28305, partial [bacterium]|nr:hypothetical protein [bacterium]
EIAYSGDPDATQAQELCKRGAKFTSYGALEKSVEVLDESDQTNVQVRVTRHEYDPGGRLERVWSGPAVQTGGLGSQVSAYNVDLPRSRREVELIYGPEGQVDSRKFGGMWGSGPSYEEHYIYAEGSQGAIAPWPSQITLFETVPESGMVETVTTAFTRDFLGRPISIVSSDGSLVSNSYDRGAGLISTTTGAGTTTRYAFDAVQRLLRLIRPGNRGTTTNGYDIDGSLLTRQTVVGGSEVLWQTSYGHDTAGRLTGVTHDDGSTESFIYNPDSTVATRTTREGISVTYTYAPTNRLLSAVPSIENPSPETLIDPDGGDHYTYDAAGRLLTLERHFVGGGPDPTTRVSYDRGDGIGFDLAGRPYQEAVGERNPMTWTYDPWNRSTSVTMPGGLWNTTGPASGFQRSFDSLSRLTRIEATAGDTLVPDMGATWLWGGASRLFGITSLGQAKSATRFSYYGQPGSGSTGTTTWKLATLTFG